MLLTRLCVLLWIAQTFIICFFTGGAPLVCWKLFNHFKKANTATQTRMQSGEHSTKCVCLELFFPSNKRNG